MLDMGTTMGTSYIEKADGKKIWGNRNKVFSICLAYLVSLVNLVCLVYLIENVWKVENVVNILLRGILFLKAGYQILPPVLPF